MEFAGILAEGGLFDVVGTMATNLYSEILMIAGPIAIVSVAIALIVSMTSHNQKAVDASKQVIKWVIVAFIAIFILGGAFTWIYNQVSSSGGTSTFTGPTGAIMNTFVG